MFVGIVNVNVPEDDETVPPKDNTAIALLDTLELYIIAPDAEIVELVHDTSSKSTKATSPLVCRLAFCKVTPPAEYTAPHASSELPVTLL